LRSDTDCVFLYTGSHPKRRGARRKYAGKVNCQDLSRFEDLGTREDDLNGHKLIDLYAARFQIEFLFRDSKQFTGLLDCQARAAAA
jgi:hypothetical protein